MKDLFNGWRAFCLTLKTAGYKSYDAYDERYAFFEKHRTFYL